MPYTDAHLPFSGISLQSRHASHAGAADATTRALPQTIRLLQALKDHPHGLTDREAAQVLGLERSTINARRAELVKADLVYADGFRKAASGVVNTIWKAR